MMEFILASGNDHKAVEFAKLFSPSIITIKSAGKKLTVTEDGESYYENAWLKAKAYYHEFKKPVLADDSGLNIQALPNELGIQSANFGGAKLSDKERALLLLKKMEGVSDRQAYFSCVLCAYLNEREIFYFEGRMSGVIGTIYRGEGGFGYDPVFIPEESENNLTLAELTQLKMEKSHRAIASSLAQKFFSLRT